LLDVIESTCTRSEFVRGSRAATCSKPSCEIIAYGLDKRDSSAIWVTVSVSVCRQRVNTSLYFTMCFSLRAFASETAVLANRSDAIDFRFLSAVT
uniref:Secreted protein n=1 Tax=Haemonchus placei TaxID=6290 RepID=A0A0N4X082_HAEPC